MKSTMLNLLFVCSCLTILAQPKSRERYYLQTDKSGYIAGETIWFKAYVFLDFYPVDDASTLLLDLVNQDGKIMASRTLPITGGTAAGNIALPVLYPEGTYVFKLSTRLSAKSMTSAEAYTKSIYIFNPAVKDSSVAAKPGPGEPAFKFYSGDGGVVAGIKNDLYFKASDEFQHPSKVEGVIRDSKDREVLKFHDEFNGAGQIDFIPAAGEKYVAELSFPGGMRKTIALPAIKENGVTLGVETVENGKRLTVNVSGAAFREQLLTIVGVMANSVVFKKQVTIADSYTCIIPTGELPTGPVHLFVFDANKKSVASLSTFVSGETSYQPVSFFSDTLDKKPGGTNVYSLKFPDSTVGSFSISITDYDSEFSFSQNNIISDLLFYQQAQRQSPSAQTSIQARAGDDHNFQLLAATTDWSPVEFDKELLPIVPGRIADTNFLAIRGKVYNKSNNKLLNSGELTFVFKGRDSTTAFLAAPIEKDGSFELKNLVYYDTAIFKYQLNSKKNTDVLIQLDSSDRLQRNVAYAATPAEKIQLKPEALKTLALSYDYFTDTSGNIKKLEEVVLVSRTRTPTQIVNDKYTRGVFQSSGMARTVDLITYPPGAIAGNILDYLQGKVAGLLISKNGLNYTLTSQRQLSISSTPPVLIFLDEREVTAEVLLPIPIREIALVKYFPPGNSLPGTGIAALLAIYTKKVNDLNDPLDPALKNGFIYPGYSPVKDFQSTYDGATAQNYPAKTLYWNPNILVENATQPYQVSFKNNLAKRFHVVIEGFTADGKLLYFDKVIE